MCCCCLQLVLCYHAHGAHILFSRGAGNALLESLDHLVEPLRTTLTFKPSQTAVKQEIERNEELVRSALRSVVAISRVCNYAFGVVVFANYILFGFECR